MPREFTLRIELGNDAMSTIANVANALMRVSRRIVMNEYSLDESMTRGIIDDNGNTVGEWSIVINE